MLQHIPVHAANQIASDAQIIQYGEFPAGAQLPAVSAGFDTNLTFFCEVLGYSDDEIQQEVQNALQFFSERFGLEFSLTQPNELGQCFFQNATLQPVRRTLQLEKEAEEGLSGISCKTSFS